MDPEFSPGSQHVAHAAMSNPTSTAWTYDAELYLVKDETKYASSGTLTFTLAAGASRTIDFPVIMPEEQGTYLVYLDVYVAGELIAAYQATESVTVVAPPSEPFIDKFYVVTYKSGDNCPYEVHCDVGNRGAAGTHTLELWMQPGGLVQAVTFDIEPGATYHYEYRWSLAPCGASGRVWIVGDWGAETIQIPFTAGYYTSAQADVRCVKTSPTCAVLRYSSRSSWDSWHFYGRTPPTGPAEHSFSIRGDTDHWWLTIWAAIFDLLPGRTYRATGICDGYSDDTTFSTS